MFKLCWLILLTLPPGKWLACNFSLLALSVEETCVFCYFEFTFHKSDVLLRMWSLHQAIIFFLEFWVYISQFLLFFLTFLSLHLIIQIFFFLEFQDHISQLYFNFLLRSFSSHITILTFIQDSKFKLYFTPCTSTSFTFTVPSPPPRNSEFTSHNSSGTWPVRLHMQNSDKYVRIVRWVAITFSYFWFMV